MERTLTIDAGTADAARAPAPGPLALVQAFLNTIDRESGEDAIADETSLSTWLTERGLLAPGDHATLPELQRAHEVRDALCALALANNGTTVEREAVDRLNEAARGAHLTLAFAPDGALRLLPAARGVDAAIAQLLGIVYTAMAGGTWTRLKACREDACHWVFYDHSRNRSGAWCSMAVCGNRTKTRTYRERRRSRPGATTVRATSVPGGPPIGS